MNARRIPFQFSTTDPLARQRELEKRFGLQPTCPKMYVDVNNPLSMGTTPKEISSPRLQHRVPIFAEGYDQPIHSSSVDSMASVPESKKPNVRVIPIEIEGADRSPRHRTYSGPAGTVKDRCDSLASERNGVPPFKRFNFEGVSQPTKPKLYSEPKVFNIPIQIEDTNVSRSPKSAVNKGNATHKSKFTVPTSNGCSQSKTTSKDESPNKSEVPAEPNENQANQPKITVEILLKKVEDVLNEFKAYEAGVAEFTGTSKDKQYKYLDEMLTRCMLRLDDIDTMGNEEVRLARKSAVKKIQASIDLLESKANVGPVTSTEVPEMHLVPGEKNADNEVEMQDNDILSAESTEMSGMNLIDSDSKEDQIKVSDVNLGDCETKTESKIESIKIEEKSHNVADVEMSEMPQEETSVNTSLCETKNVNGYFESETRNLSEISSKTDVMCSEDSSSSLQQQNNVPEIEMSDEMLDNISSANDTQSQLTGSTNECTEQDETVTNDVEMLDEKDQMSLAESKESLDKENGTHSPKSSEISEVEMDETGGISDKESDKKESDSHTVNCKSDCLEEKTGLIDVNVQVASNVTSENADVISGDHQTVNDCVTDLPGKD